MTGSAIAIAPRSGSGGSVRKLPSAWPVAAGVATLLTSRVRNAQAPMHLDTARDLLIARDFAEGEVSGMGATSSFGQLVHGALWPHILSLRFRFGIGIVAFERFVDVMLAVSAALFAWMCVVAVERRPGFTGWALWLFPTLIAVEHPILWNPTLSPFALGLFYLALIVGVRRGSPAAFLGASIALGVAIDFHVSGAIMLPAFFVTLLACARQPIITAVLAALAMLEVWLVFSPVALEYNARRLEPVAWLIVSGALAVFAGGLFLRSRLARMTAVSRVRAILAGVASVMVVTLLALSRVSGRAVEWRYLGMVVIPAALLLVSVLPRAPLARLPLEIAAVIMAVAIPPGEHRGFKLREAPAMASALYRRGSFDDLFRHLRGPEAFHVLSTVASFETAPTAPSLSDDLLVLRVRRGRALPAGAEVIDLSPEHVAVLLAYMPRVDTSVVHVCRSASDCTTVVANPADLPAGATTRWARRAYPGIGAFHRLALHGGELSVKLALHETETATFVQLQEPHCNGWIITAATPPSTPLPATSATVGGSAGSFTVTARDCRPTYWFPPFVEAPATNTALVELLRAE